MPGMERLKIAPSKTLVAGRVWAQKETLVQHFDVEYHCHLQLVASLQSLGMDFNQIRAESPVKASKQITPQL